MVYLVSFVTASPFTLVYTVSFFTESPTTIVYTIAFVTESPATMVYRVSFVTESSATIVLPAYFVTESPATMVCQYFVVLPLFFSLSDGVRPSPAIDWKIWKNLYLRGWLVVWLFVCVSWSQQFWWYSGLWRCSSFPNFDGWWMMDDWCWMMDDGWWNVGMWECRNAKM